MMRIEELNKKQEASKEHILPKLTPTPDLIPEIPEGHEKVMKGASSGNEGEDVKNDTSTNSEGKEIAKDTQSHPTAQPQAKAGESEAEFLKKILQIQHEGGFGRHLDFIINERLKLIS